MRIRSTATALPGHRLSQADVRRACADAFRGHPRLAAYLEMFDRCGVEHRHFAFPASYYFEERPFAARNRDYVEQAMRLGARAIRGALDRAGCGPRDIDRMFFVTTTGLATPSVDALLAGELGFRPDLQRNPLFGLGCAGGTAALARAAQIGEGRSLVVSIELCAQTFRPHDDSMANLVATTLFADGAAAVVLDDNGPGPQIVRSGAELFPGTRDTMGWDFLDDGFRLVLSPEVPKVIKEHVVPAVRRFVGGDRVDHHVLHPGGSRILAAFESAMGADLRWSRDSLRRIGNLSSASILFVLDDLLNSGVPRAGDTGLIASVGPGFALEASLVRW